MPKHQGRGQAQVLTAEEIDLIIQRAAPAYRGIFAITAYTGCRISEACKLQVHRIDRVNRCITFVDTKNGDDRSVPICNDLAAILDTLSLPREGWAFPSPLTDSHLSRVAVHLEMRTITDDMGLIGVSTHSFRRSLATQLHRNGTPIKTIAKVTGHRSIDSLQRYIDVTDDEMRDALNNRRQP